MIGTVLAFLAALSYGLSAVLTRKKLNESNYFSATFILTAIGNLVLWPLAVMFTNFKIVNFQGILFFVIAGILAPGLMRLFYNKGMEIFGVSVNAAIYATYPVCSSILAILLLGEAPTPENWIGVICITAGVIFIERSLGNSKAEFKVNSKKFLIFPLLATLTTASSQLISKYGLAIYNEPLLGVAIGYAVSLILYTLLLTFSKRYPRPSQKDLQLFWKPGFFLSLGWALSFYALSYENISIVAPLLQTEPLFILFLAHFQLKGLEHVRPKVVMGIALIVTGAVLLIGNSG